MVTLFYLLILEQILQGLYSLRQGIDWLKFARKRLASATGLYAPRVALICPVKGLEENLEANLTALTQFDFPQYELFFAIASKEDPAYRLLERVASASKRPVHIVRSGPAIDCSDKVHNLAAAVNQLSDEFEVIVFADSDGRPPRRWLARLVAPLVDHTLGAVTTFRWLFPDKSGFWSSLASAWNASSATYLGEHKNNFCWGGGTAIRRAVFDQIHVLDAWKGAVSDDYALTQALQYNGLRIGFVPECLVPSRCKLNFRSFVEFTNRQMVITRVYGRKVWLTVVIGYSFYCAAIVAGIASWILNSIEGLPSLQFVVLLLIPPIFAAVRGALRLIAVTELMPEMKDELLSDGWIWVLLAPLVPFVYIYNAFVASFTRRIVWRGIHYELISPSRTRVLRR